MSPVGLLSPKQELARAEAQRVPIVNLVHMEAVIEKREQDGSEHGHEPAIGHEERTARGEDSPQVPLALTVSQVSWWIACWEELPAIGR